MILVFRFDICCKKITKLYSILNLFRQSTVLVLLKLNIRNSRCEKKRFKIILEYQTILKWSFLRRSVLSFLRKTLKTHL